MVPERQSTAFHVRRATIDDLDALVRLRLALAREVGNLTDDADVEPLTRALHDFFLKTLPTGAFISYVADVDGQVVGCSGLQIAERPPYSGNLSGREAYVMNMYTIPEWRGRGVATGLLRAIIGYVTETGGGRIWLRATEAGRTLYEREGFVARASYMERFLR